MPDLRVSRIVSLVVLLVIIVVTGALFFRVMVNLLVPLFLALLCVVMFRPLHAWILQRSRRPHLAAALTTAAIMLIVLVPAFSIITLAAIEGSAAIAHMEIGTLKQNVAKLRNRFGLQMPHEEELRAIEALLDELKYPADSRAVPTPERIRSSHEKLVAQVRQLDETLTDQEKASVVRPDVTRLMTAVGRLNAGSYGSSAYEQAVIEAGAFYDVKTELCGGSYWAQLVEWANPNDEKLRQWRGYMTERAQSWLLSIGGATTTFAGQLLMGAFIMTVSVFFFLLDGPKMTEALMRLSPLDDRYEHELVQEFDQISRAIVLATVLSAVAQGLLAGVGYWVAGLPSVFLLMLLTMVMSMVPFIGATSVWAPAALWLYLYGERTWPAVLLAIYGVAVVSAADNLIKPWVLHGRSKLHPLLALLSVIGGVQALGPIGILVGPMIVVFLQTLLNILHREMTAMDRSPTIASSSAGR